MISAVGLTLLAKRPQAGPRARAAFWTCAVLGTLLIADDALQHGVQRWGGDPAYRSPLHRLYGKIYHVPVVRAVNRWLDREIAP